MHHVPSFLSNFFEKIQGHIQCVWLLKVDVYASAKYY